MQSVLRPGKPQRRQTAPQPAAIVLIRIAGATKGGRLGEIYVGDKLLNNFHLFTQFLQLTDLCTFMRTVEALYKHCIQNSKALIKKNKNDLPTIVAMLYLLQLLLSLNFQNLLIDRQTLGTQQKTCLENAIK